MFAGALANCAVSSRGDGSRERSAERRTTGASRRGQRLERASFTGIVRKSRGTCPSYIQRVGQPRAVCSSCARRSRTESVLWQNSHTLLAPAPLLSRLPAVCPLIRARRVHARQRRSSPQLLRNVPPTEGVFRQMLSTISGTGQCAEQKQAEITAHAAADAARQAMWCGRLEHGARNRECPLLQSPTFPKSST